MKTSANGRKVLSASEGVELTAYLDSVGVWTIGVGHTASAGPPTPVKGMTITKAECDAILARDLALFEKELDKLLKVPVNQNQYDALINLIFNIGAGAFARSTLLRKLNAGDYAGAAEQFLVWNKAGGQTLKGLVARRERERKLFLTPVGKVEAPVEKPVEKPAEAPVVAPAPTPTPKAENWLVKLLRALREALRK